MKNNNDYTHYVIFSPAKIAGIYMSWAAVDKAMEGVGYTEFLGLWSQKQAEIAFRRGFDKARTFKQHLIDMGWNKPTKTIDPKDYVIPW